MAHRMSIAQGLELLAKELKCPVCLRLFSLPVTKTKCNHYFCGACLEQSMAHKQECPMCKTPARRREVTEDPLVGRIATHFAYVAQAEGLEVFMSQQLQRRASGGHTRGAASRPAAPSEAPSAGAGAARASPSRYSTAPGSLPASPSGEAACGDAARGPPSGQRSGAPAAARKAAPRGRRSLAAAPSASPAPPERDAFTTPFPAAAAAAASPAAASLPPLFWLGDAGAAQPAQREEEDAPYDEPYDDEYGVGGYDDPPADDDAPTPPPGDDADADADVPAVELPSADAPVAGRGAAGGVPAPTGEASSYHVQCGQGAPAEGDDDAVASGGKRSKAAAAARLQRARDPAVAAHAPKAAARSRPAPPPPPPLFASPGAVEGTPADAPRRAVRAARQDWACGLCTLENPITVQRCNACGTRRGASPPAALPEAAAVRAGPPASASKRGREATTPRGCGGGMLPPPAPATVKRRRPSDEGEKENVTGPATGGKGSRARAAWEAPTPRGAAAAATLAAVTPATVRRAAPKTPAEALGDAGQWPAVARSWVLSPSGLNGDQKKELKDFADACGATYSREWSEAVTHVVAGLDDQGRAKRTMKYMCALLTGQWVVSPAWTRACLASRSAVPEAAHEARGDDRGGSGTAAAAHRQRLRSGSGGGLFADLKVHLTGDFVSPSRSELEQLVQLGGGRMLRHAPSPPSPGKALDPGLRVICEGPPADGAPSAAAPRGGRASAVEAAKTATGAPALAHYWLLDSVTHAELRPITDKYILTA